MQLTCNFETQPQLITNNNCMLAQFPGNVTVESPIHTGGTALAMAVPACRLVGLSVRLSDPD